MSAMIRTLFAGLCLSLPLTSGVLAADAPAINACELLSAAEITSAIGVSVTEGRRRDDGRQADGSYSSACLWMIQARPPADPRARRFVILNVMQWPEGRDMSRRYLQAFRDSAEQGVIPSKPSPRKFGDESLWWGDGLAVRKGDVSFGVSVFMPDAPSNQPVRTSVLEEKLVPIILRKVERRAAANAI
ncbi:hypothetical protein [Povalibacter sp.]|uniref:hypothetical protein n=1 Tax=Povalibacter sp. TaxID=1962978 RepID=UPI002F3ED756